MSITQEAESILLANTDVSPQVLSDALKQLHQHQLHFSDIYLQRTLYESWSLESGIVKEGTYSDDTGLGVRAIVNDKTGFAYADEISKDALLKAVSAAKHIAKVGSSADRLKVFGQSITPPQLYPSTSPLEQYSRQNHVELLQKINQHARQADSRIQEVMASLSLSHEVVLIVASDGTYVGDIRPLVRLNVTVIAEENGRREQGYGAGGGRFELERLYQDDYWQNLSHQAVRIACLNLNAQSAPAGEMPVVLAPGWPGVLLHEAVGHGLEGDFNRKKTSVFSGKVGQQVAAKGVTVVDNGTIAERRGSLSVDDEGVPTQRTVLIEDGILVGYMQDKLNAKLMGVSPTGNGRRESYAYLPMPRMTNTYMEAGEFDPQEIIESVDNGIYAVNFAGGQVDITNGKFVFAANEAYLIENGKITAPVKGATLIGDGATAMNAITLIGNDLALDSGVGVCGKSGQSVPVGVGLPTIKVGALTVGGTA